MQPLHNIKPTLPYLEIPPLKEFVHPDTGTLLEVWNESSTTYGLWEQNSTNTRYVICVNGEIESRFIPTLWYVDEDYWVPDDSVRVRI